MTTERTTAAPTPRPPDADAEIVIDLTDAAVAESGGRRVIDLTVGPVPGGPAAVPATAASSLELLSPLALLAAVNALNVLDAALTVIWIDLGIAREANPVVDAIGFPGKVVAVALGSWVVYRLKPRWLLVPAIALAGVCLYHLGGAAFVFLG